MSETGSLTGGGGCVWGGEGTEGLGRRGAVFHQTPPPPYPQLLLHFQRCQITGKQPWPGVMKALGGHPGTRQPCTRAFFNISLTERDLWHIKVASVS